MKVIIFDLDGTLSRTDRFMVPSIRSAMEQMGLPKWTDKEILSTIGEPVEETNYRLFGKSQCEMADCFWHEVAHYYDAVFHESVESYEGADRLLDELHKQNYRTAVCSNADRDYIEEVLGKIGLLDKIDKIRPIIPGKGKIESLRAFLQEEKPEFALLVGDRFYDLEAARANQTIFVACLYGCGTEEELKNADYTIEKPLDLLTVLKKM